MNHKLINNSFYNLKKYLEKFSIYLESKIPDSTILKGINSLELADKNNLSFYCDYKLLSYLKSSNAFGCFIKKEFKELLPNDCFSILVKNPYLCYAHTSNFFSPPLKSNGLISINSIVCKNVSLGKNVQLGNFSTLEDSSIIEENVIIGNNVFIGPNVSIGFNTIIENNCSITNTFIGNNCHIKSGTIVGGTGFGFNLDTKISISHIGNVKIGNNVFIGSNCCIDRASLDSTIIEDNSRLDNLIQIAHGVNISNNTIIAGQVGIAGSAKIGSNCIIGGQVGISGHINIGNNVIIAAKSGVTKNIPDNMTIAGFPAIDIIKWKKNLIKLNKKNI